MSRWRDAAALAALIVSQGCWLLLLGGILGAATQHGASLLPWPTLFLLVAVAAVVTRLLGASPLPPLAMRIGGVAISLSVLYAAIAIHNGAAWPLDFRELDPLGASRLGATAAFALFLWWRGARIGGAFDPENALRTSFKVGLVFLVLAALVEIGYKQPLGVGWIAIPFFTASLAGLAFMTVVADDQQPRTRWGRVVIGTIAGAFALAAVASLAVGGFLSSAASSAFRAIGLVAYWVSYAAFFVLEKIIIGIFAVLRGIGNLFGQPDILRMLRPPSLLSQRPEAAQDAPLTGVWAVVVAGVKWGLIVLGVLILLLFLAWLFNRSRRRAPEEENEVRESLRDEVTTEPLLGNLLHRRGKDGPDLYPIPDGSDPRSRLLRSYFRALNMALQRGLPRAAAETPAEYSPRLAAALPGVPAAELTDAFVRARYGGQPPSDATADRLERTLDGQQQAP